MQFFENDENEMRISKERTGEGDSIAVPFPRPHLLLRDARKAQQETVSVPKDFVSLQGFTPRTWEQLGNKTCRILCNMVTLDAGRNQTNQRDALFTLDVQPGGQGFEPPQVHQTASCPAG